MFNENCAMMAVVYFVFYTMSWWQQVTSQIAVSIQ